MTNKHKPAHPRFSPAAAARWTLRRLRESADPERAAGVRRYFRETVHAFGVSAPRVRELARELHARTRGDWRLGDAVALCDRLLPRPELEAKGVATLVLLRFHREFDRPLFTAIEDWLEKEYLANWASVDTLCPQALAVLLTRFPDLQKELRGWSRSRNRWLRRASIVAFLKLVKREEFLQPAYAMAARHFGSDDDLVQKAAGWLLRESGKRGMERLQAFLLAHGPSIPRTTLRYAIERFPEKKRKQLLEATRGQ